MVVVECVVGVLDGSLDEVGDAFGDEFEVGFAVVDPVVECGSESVGEEPDDGQGVSRSFSGDGVT